MDRNLSKTFFSSFPHSLLREDACRGVQVCTIPQQSHASCSPQINRSGFMQMNGDSLLDFIQTVIKGLGKGSWVILIAGYTRA